MATKLQLLVVVTLGLTAQAINDSISPKKDTMDATTAKTTGAELEAAFKEVGDNEGDKTLNSIMASMLPKGEASDFEGEIAGLVLALSKGGFGGSVDGSGLGKSVKKIKKVIDVEMLPAINAAHAANQRELIRLKNELVKCGKTKDVSTIMAKKSQVTYQRMSPPHKVCRQGEANLYTENLNCWKDLHEKWKIKELKCNHYSTLSKRYGDQNRNKNIVNKGGSEDVVTYVKRISSTICGNDGKKNGFKDKLLAAKKACEKATKEWFDKDKMCKALDKKWTANRAKCNSMQDIMDNAACKWAVDMKDACEAYDECYKAKKRAYDLFEKSVRTEEAERKTEWRGTQRMRCIIIAFEDGKIENSEITKCKMKTHNTDHLIIKYPKLPPLVACIVPGLYPYTALYKKAEFKPLPPLAKGKMDANPCTGVGVISTDPAPGSPKSCKCERVTLNGPYAAGAMVKCTNCLEIRRASEKSSCPAATKLFSPRSRQDWDTFLKSAQPLRAPNWIVDVTRPQNGCGGCTRHPMNPSVAQQKSWTTKDGSPWWLRSKRYNEPNGDYHANCYLDLWHNPSNADSITFNDGSCSYRSKSYYCQSAKLSLKPKPGSPKGCACKKVEISQGLKYTGGMLIRCDNCLKVYRSTQKNSCPHQTKLFAPRSREDWKAFIASAKSLRAPHWIIDVTRPQNGCGGCTKHPMNSKVAPQASWRTADKAPWWLRSTRYNEPNGDYTANCYLDLWQHPANENSVTWNDGRCTYHSKSYYCQLAKVKVKKTTTTLAPPWKICCKLPIAKCLACKKKLPVEEFCAKYSSTKGCPMSRISTKPKSGSPSTCTCKLVALKGQYVAGALLKCQNCLQVSKSKDKNSCPVGTKVFSPSNQADWKTFFASIPNAKREVAHPNFIVDVTRPKDGCGGCTGNAMNSGNAKQKSWRTSDGTPWWFRDRTYSEPNGDYTANCYLDLWHSPTANNIMWNDGRCSYKSKSYYCQPIRKV